jgi:hypothetical protein
MNSEKMKKYKDECKLSKRQVDTHGTSIQYLWLNLH